MKTPEEIKKGLKCCIEENCGECPYISNCQARTHPLQFDALTYINYLEEHVEAYMKAVPKWISVADKLPSETDDGKNFMTRYKYKIDTYEKRCAVLAWRANRGKFEMEGFQGMHVTHWMPLPKTPEEMLK